MILNLMKMNGLRRILTFFEYQKEDLLLTDSNKNQWIVLSKKVNTGIDTVANRWLRECNGLYGYFV